MKKVVVIGGGFAGSYLAKKLEKNFNVVLIDAKEYFEFTPGILRTIVEPEHIRKVQVMHSHYLKSAKIIVGNVKEVSDSFVLVNGRKVKFDYLVICSGSSYSLPIKEKEVVIATRAKHLRDCYDKLCVAKKVLIIGGGLVGVELAGEISTFYPDKKITIVHNMNKLIQRNNTGAIDYATKFLKRRGVELIYGEKFSSGSRGKYVTDKGRKIGADMVFLCTGIIPNYEFLKKKFSGWLNERNQVKVNEFLQVEERTNIFSAGDVNSCTEEKTAQNAERQAEIIAKNICLMEKGGRLKRYESKSTPMIISLGKYNGIYTYDGFNMYGKIPALMKAVIEWWEMWKKRL